MTWKHNPNWVPFFNTIKTIRFLNKDSLVQISITLDTRYNTIRVHTNFDKKLESGQLKVEIIAWLRDVLKNQNENDNANAVLSQRFGNPQIKDFLLFINSKLKELIPRAALNDVLIACGLNPLPEPKSLFNLCCDYIKYRYDQYAPYTDKLPENIKESLTATEESDQDFKRRRIDCSTDKPNFKPSQQKPVKLLMPNV